MKSGFIAYCLMAIVLLVAAPPLLSESAAGHQADDYFDMMVVIGEVEHVTIEAAELRFKARIDTGAETSSLGIVSQQMFERDGRGWVHFTIQDPDSGRLVELERPLERVATIKRHGAESQERPVVKLQVSLANVEMLREFTLTDRSKFTYPVLVGRNILSGIFIVDVNKQYAGDSLGVVEE